MSEARGEVRWMHTGPWPVYIGFTTSEEAFAREMRKLGAGKIAFTGTNGDACTHSFYNKDGKSCFIITMPPHRPRRHSREQYAALLAHEATHVIQTMRDDLAGGETLGREAEAYLVQMIVQEGLQLAWRTGRSKRTTP